MQKRTLCGGPLWLFCERPGVFVPSVCAGAGSSFGGNRNRIFYEVDCRTLSDGDKIEGVFDLVTNGGEKKLPYSFVVESDPVGKILAGLKQPEDFAKLVRLTGSSQSVCLNTVILRKRLFTGSSCPCVV